MIAFVKIKIEKQVIVIIQRLQNENSFLPINNQINEASLSWI